MDGKIVQIQPLEVVTVKHKHSFSVTIMHVVMFESVSLSIAFYDENNACIDRENITLTGADYSNWGTDDNYLVNYVAAKYGMQVQN
jgi:hypothetical protein